MKVCIICEGSYPYVVGGVSSWVQMIVEKFDTIDFIIWSIATSREEMSEIKYKLPKNVIDIKTIYLSDNNFKTGKKNKIKLKKREYNALRSLVSDDFHVTWADVIALIRKYTNRLSELLLSDDFFNIGVELYNEAYDRVSFNDFIWHLRSMYFSLIASLSGEIPEADIYHAVSTGYAGLLGSAASSILDRPLVLTEHGIYTREREEEIIKSDWVIGDFKNNWINFFYKISKVTYEQATQVVTLFGTNRQLEIEMGCPEEKAIIIPNGVDVGAYDNLKSLSKIPRDKINIGTVARVVPIKDIKTMLFAFEAAKQKNKNIRLCILGPFDEDLEYYEECMDLVEELEIKDDVLFPGRVNVKEYLPDFDIMLLTSISEGQPLAVLESMAARLPQICTNVGSCSEFLMGGEGDNIGTAGIIANVMDVEALSAAILKLADDPKLRKEMGEIGHKRVSRYYQKDFFLNRYYELYHELVKKQD